MRKYIFTICDQTLRALLLAGIVACVIVWKNNPDKAFTFAFLGFMGLFCYITLERVEASLSEEKRYLDIWRRDRRILFSAVFMVLFVIGVIIATVLGPQIAAGNAEEARLDQTNAITDGAESVKSATTQSAESIVNAVKKLEKRLAPTVDSMNASIAKLALHTAALEKTGEDVKALGKGISELQSEVAGLKNAVSGLDQAVRSLKEINRKILEQKTEK